LGFISSVPKYAQKIASVDKEVDKDVNAGQGATQTPFGLKKSRSDYIGGGDAINFSPLQLLEEAAHKQSGLVITIVRHRVFKRRYAQAVQASILRSA
jgi:hypothetical protein